MYQLYRVVVPGSEALLAASTVDAVKSLVVTLPPGTYRVDELNIDDKLGRSTTRQWGTVTRELDGKVMLEQGDPPFPGSSGPVP